VNNVVVGIKINAIGELDQGRDKRSCKSSALTICGAYEPADDKFYTN